MSGAGQSGVFQSSPINREVALSTLLHVLLALTALVALPTPGKISLPDYALPVEVVTIDEFTRLVAKQEAPDAPAPPEREQPPLPERVSERPDVKSGAVPLPEARSEKPKSPETLPAPVNLVGDAVPLVRPRPVKPRRKPLLDTAAVRALLDKTPDLPEPAAPKPLTELPPGERMSLSEIDAFRAQIRACWSVPVGAKNAENLVVRVRVQMDPSGRPTAKKVINRAQLSNSYFLSAAESVLRAIERCQPYKMPPEKYDSWRELELNFDPGKMLNG